MSRQLGDALSLRGELILRVDLSFADFLACGQQLRRARSANPAAPMFSNMPKAARSCCRASARLFSRRSHSPYSRWVRASSGLKVVRERHGRAD